MASVNVKFSEKRGKKSSHVQSKRDNYKAKHQHFKGNVEKGQGFADIRKKKMFYQYKKILKKEQHNQEKMKKTVADLYKGEAASINDEQQRGSLRKHPQMRNEKKMSAFEKPRTEYLRKKEDKNQKYQDKQKEQKERDEAMEMYQNKKKKRQKLMAKKTERGQPHIGSQMQFLLEKIEKQMGTS